MCGSSETGPRCRDTWPICRRRSARPTVTSPDVFAWISRRYCPTGGVETQPATVILAELIEHERIRVHRGVSVRGRRPRDLQDQGALDIHERGPRGVQGGGISRVEQTRERRRKSSLDGSRPAPLKRKAGLGDESTWRPGNVSAQDCPA